MRPTDIELMQLARGGDRGAFAEIVTRYQKSLVNFFRRMGARTHEVDDLVQDTFLRTWSYRERWTPSGKFSNFLYVLARHAWGDFARRAIRAPHAEANVADDAQVDGHAGLVHVRLDVEAALATLSDKLRMVVVLNLWQGLKYQEVAEVLDVPLGTVKSRMHLALKQLRDTLGDED